ncbi:hypothetical protein LZK98_11580 [Sphingomonas cannabina]|uniref:DUF6950 family protein n=1 Tax=Sphingomonas cannabina TaxID=2899123 RepID=UPI001F38BBBF|nr:hypothetical protein [Sphingomonas cannabina]UIJ43731.1 hypothetical protein LZK98_11580 [Sphingomonas cannabina]
MTEIERRVAVTRATQARFAGRPHAYGSVDCVRVAAWHLRKMGRKVTGLAKAGSYKTAKGARRALTRAGFSSLVDAIQANGLVEIAPAAALPGDLMTSAGTDDLEAICIYAGNGAMLGFSEEAMASGLQAIRIADFSAIRAWRA